MKITGPWKFFLYEQGSIDEMQCCGERAYLIMKCQGEMGMEWPRCVPLLQMSYLEKKELIQSIFTLRSYQSSEVLIRDQS